MTVYKLTIRYDGGKYHGWQYQPGVPTIQAALDEAIERTFRQTTRSLGCSRTDAGVHAMGQVAQFEVDSTLAVRSVKGALNRHLPDDISIVDVEVVPRHFHAIRHASKKLYRYVFCDAPGKQIFRRAYCWQIPFPLDADRMQAGALHLLGTHDFACFQTKGAERESTVRTLFSLTVRRNEPREEGFITLEVEGNGFLYNMVRAISGTLYDVGRGRREPAWVAEVLASRDRQKAGMTAPSQGLFLVRITYPDPLPPPDERFSKPE